MSPVYNLKQKVNAKLFRGVKNLSDKELEVQRNQVITKGNQKSTMIMSTYCQVDLTIYTGLSGLIAVLSRAFRFHQEQKHFRVMINLLSCF